MRLACSCLYICGQAWKVFSRSALVVQGWFAYAGKRGWIAPTPGATDDLVMASGQPSGTVTLVFTDIEGSTRLLEELGTDAYREALAEHRRVVREAFGQGYEVDYEGDAFFYAFASAQAAVEAVAEAMRGLESGPIRIRVGVHTGRPEVDPPKYVGRDVHLAARVMSAAHGGQVLLSAATRELVEVEAMELGEHRLKDFAQPVSLFQLGEGSFPPLKTISNTNLPRPASSFVGREREVAEVVALVRGGARVVTLTGPGGTGKTRLAIEAAAELVPEFKAGLFWVGLAALRDPALLVGTVAQTLGAKGGLAEHVGERELLLLLDNLEQVVEAAAELAALVETCPKLVLLVTSRELLRVRGEVEYQVPPLAAGEAVSLFCQRSRLDATADIRELCSKLDQMPLAVELAAARTRALTPAQILDRLGGRLDLLKGGRDADPRQQTLRATIEWSYDLLSPEEQLLFARLAVFAGGCTLEAAEEVAGADLDTLQSLVEKSLIRHTNERYWMLETIREYASERQISHEGEEASVRERHSSWVFSWGREFDARQDDQEAALTRLRHELPNVRVAFHELSTRGRLCDRLELATALAQGMFQLGAARESKTWLEETLRMSATCPDKLRTRALAEASIQAAITGDSEAAVRHAADAAELVVGLDEPKLRGEVLLAASLAQWVLGRLAEAERLTTEALAYADETGNEALAGDLRNNLCYLALQTGKLQLAREMGETALADARRRADLHLTAGLLHNLSLVAIRSDALQEATRYLAEALKISRQHGLEDTLRHSLDGLAAVVARSGSYELAATLLGRAACGDPLVGEVEALLRGETEREARAELGVDAFAECSEVGAALSLDEVANRAADWLAAADLESAP